jgi:hypothetical protein
MAIRKTLTVRANDEEYLVRELTVAEIIGFLDNPAPQGEEEGDGSVKDTATGLLGQVDQVLAIAVKGLKAEDLKSWAPSEIEKLYNGFKEVNSTFFAIAQRIGLGSLMEEVRQAIAADFSSLFANSLRQGTGKP